MIDFFAIGFYAAVLTYGLIVIWTVLARLRGLRNSLVRGVHRPLDRLCRVPVLGRVVAACRRYPLSLGLLIAIGVGVAVPYVIMSVMWLIYGLSFLLVFALGAWALSNSDEEEGDTFPRSYKLYNSRYGGGRIVPGYDVEADRSRPWL